jgi:hypothetical protein
MYALRGSGKSTPSAGRLKRVVGRKEPLDEKSEGWWMRDEGRAAAMSGEGELT